MNKGTLPGSAHIGHIRLAISDLSKSLRFYTDVLGLAIRSNSAGVAQLTAQGRGAEVLIELEEMPGIRPLGRGSRLGLYHFALLLPSRNHLASFVTHLTDKRCHFGASDHLVSEALYLVDPDGIQIEVYADRPRRTWIYKQGELLLGSEPLRFGDLLAKPHDSWEGLPAKTTLGHLHFYVGDLEGAKNFFCEGLGFEVSHSSIPGALFVAVGGYHHHIGLNTWAGEVPNAGPADARLLHWELVLEDGSQVDSIMKRVADAGFPDLFDLWHNKVLLSAQGSGIL